MVRVVEIVAAPVKVIAPVVLVKITVGAVVVPVMVVELLFVSVKLLTLRLPEREITPPVPPLTVND